MIHFLYTRWAKVTACGVARASIPRGRYHMTYTPARVTCNACLRIIGEVST